MDPVAAGAVLLLLLIAGFGAMAESAIDKISRPKAHQLLDAGRSGAPSLVEIVADPAPYLNVTLLVSVAAQVGGTVIATGIAIDRLGGNGEIAAAAAMTLLVFVVAQIAPRTYAVQNPERSALLAARPTRVIGKFLSPVGRLLILLSNVVSAPLPGRGLPRGPFVTEEEIRAMVDVAEEDETIEEEERELIHSVFEFGDTVVREVMVPRPDMVTVPSNASLKDALEEILRAGYSRIPIFEGDIDNIVGVVYAKDLLKRIHENGEEDVTVAALARAPLFVPEQKKIPELLREMQSKRVHMAIVVDEYGGTAGLVTIEDLIEEIVGEIVDEYDQEEPLVEPLEGSALRVDAKLPIDEVNELLGVELPHDEWDTVGGLVFGLTGRVPVAGETVVHDGVVFETERVTGRRIQKVVIRRAESETVEGSG